MPDSNTLSPSILAGTFARTPPGSANNDEKQFRKSPRPKDGSNQIIKAPGHPVQCKIYQQRLKVFLKQAEQSPAWMKISPGRK